MSTTTEAQDATQTQPRPDDHGRPAYKDPTGDAAARNIMREAAQKALDQRLSAKGDSPEPVDGDDAEQPDAGAPDGTNVRSEPVTGASGDAAESAGGEPVGDAAEPGPGDRTAYESAKYRKRAQEAEAERDTLRDQLTGIRTHILVGVVGTDGATVEALTAGGYDVNTLFAEDGQPDLEAIEAARVDVEKRFNITRKPGPLNDRTPRAMLRGGSTPGEAPTGNRWTAAFAKK